MIAVRFGPLVLTESKDYSLLSVEVEKQQTKFYLFKVSLLQ